MSIIVERHQQVLLLRLNRPEVLNALDTATMREILEVLEPVDEQPDVGCIVITGSDHVFAAGADIREMSAQSFIDVYRQDFFAGWERFAKLRTPKIAAVSGYAFGGGCELAMMCDTIYAAEGATFGQPEIQLGVIPGIGGTQRLTRLIGKAKAVDMILTGKTISAREAEQAGLVARVFRDEVLLDETLHIAEMISRFSAPAVMMALEAVNAASESALSQGLRHERRLFHTLFTTQDRREGMRAFLEKRPPVFKNC